MGTARQPAPVKLIASLLTGDLDLLPEVRATLVHAFGPIDLESDILLFDHTDYYAPEFGPALQRQFVTFECLISPEDLPAVKRQTNDLEQSLAREGRRRVNIDPGYVSLSKLVLATTKDHAHRLYLGEGIYAEVTLAYRHGAWQPWPWTYPDYRSEEYAAILSVIRALYMAQLRALSARAE